MPHLEVNKQLLPIFIQILALRSISILKLGWVFDLFVFETESPNFLVSTYILLACMEISAGPDNAVVIVCVLEFQAGKVEG